MSDNIRETLSPSSASLADGETDSEEILYKLDAFNIQPSNVQVEMSSFQFVASYNWLDRSEPTILVPGAPAIWSPPAQIRKLEPDRGEVFIDQNAARYPNYPMEPMIRAVKEMRPDYDMTKIDIAIDRNSFAKLYASVTRDPKNFEVVVEMIGKTAFFVRKEKYATENIVDFRGFGRTFPDEYTRWEKVVGGSTSHHRIAEFDFPDLKFLVRFESDGYLPQKAGEVKIPVSDGTAGATGMEKDDSDISITEWGIADKKPLSNSKLVISRQGYPVNSDSTIDIKTRAVRRALDLGPVLPRLWISQTKNLVVGYHQRGKFDIVQIRDMSADIEQWEQQHSLELRKLHALLLLIIDTLKGTGSGKCRVTGSTSGDLEIKALGDEYPSAMPSEYTSKKSSGSLEEKDAGIDDKNTRDATRRFDGTAALFKKV